MNERIKQLADEAESSANEVFDFDGRGYYDIVMAKFAELIVRECADIAADQSAIRPEYRIRTHFGVEE
tara:strand:+ start:165 stop:368 length:204 start_codon:yes stop_codon:yes gene_type:complete